MNLFPFFKKKERTGVDSTLDSSDLLKDAVVPAAEDDSVKPSLYLPLQWNIGKEQEYVLRFLSNELPSLKPNQISLSGISININQSGESWNVEAFLRSSINQPIKLGITDLLLIDKHNNPIASQEFDLLKIGEIPENSNLPWVFEFHKNNIKAKEIPASGWKLAFNPQSLFGHTLDLDNEWKEKLSPEEEQQLQNLVDSLPSLKPNEVNVTGFQIEFTEENVLVSSVLFRNGSSKNVQLNRISLEIRDSSDSVIAKGVFELNNFVIINNSSKPWTFVFPKENVINSEPDLSSWKALIV